MAESQHHFTKSSALDDDGNINSTQNKEISNSRKKSVRKKKNTSEGSAGGSLTTNDGGLQAADHLIQELDATVEPQAGKGRQKRSLTRSTVASNSNDLGRKRSNADPCTSSNVERKTGVPSRIKAFDDNGRVDLDAVEKWVSDSSIDIDLGSEKKFGHSVSKQQVENKNVPDKFEKADVAVSEIDTIVKGLSPQDFNEPLKKSKSTSVSSARNKQVAVPLSSGHSSTSKISEMPRPMPAASCPRPLQPIRLPPVKISSTRSEDVFKEKFSNTTSPHISSDLQKCVQPNRDSFSAIKESSELPGKAEISGSVRKAQTTGSAAKYAVENLLPGQVSENRFDEDNTEEINIRTIVLDYSASECKRNKKRGKGCGLVRFCTRLCCCCNVQADDVEVVKRSNTKSRTDNLKQTRRSIPRRVWKRVKRCFGF
ncbi:uncharacterized protein LOC123545564 [Mercenaria mercenaria]|uniref:uncharacterized protein LOC123545564 n=1 Tax=Mercenaria mercenaria TaxID=6596 RepID=UPI00234F340D|nr:uncharacterized protein LOC123545564 [Mercenaria mercenaria]